MRKFFTAVAAALSLTAFAQSEYLTTEPAPGTTVTELYKIELICNNPRYQYVEIYTMDDIKLKKDGQVVCGVVKDGYSDTTAKLALEFPISADGVYTLDLPAGSWCVASETSAPVEDVAASFTWTVGQGGGGQTEEQFTITPPSNSQVTAPFGSITITSNDPSNPLVDAVSIGDAGIFLDDTKVASLKASNNDDGSLVLTFWDKANNKPAPIETAGIYTIKLDDGALELNTLDWGAMVPVALPEMRLVYMVSSGQAQVTAEFIADPQNNATLTEPLTMVKITSGTEGYTSVEVNDIEAIQVYFEDELYSTVKNKKYGACELELQTPGDKSGTYTVLFPAGCISMWDYSDENEAKCLDNDAFTLTYNVEVGGPKFNVELMRTRLTPAGDEENPAPIGEGSSINQFNIDVNGEYYPVEGSTVNFVNKRAGFNHNATVTADAPRTNFGSKRTRFYFTFAEGEGITTNGTYTLTIPQGILGDAEYVADHNTGAANKAYTWEVICVDGLPEPEPSVKYDLGIKETKPATGKVDLSEVTWEVTTFGIDAAYDLAPNSEVEATLVCETAGYSQSGKIKLSMFTQYTRTLKFTCSEPRKNGTYIMTIPQGTFGDAEWQADPETGHTNPEIKVYFLVEGASGDVTTAYDLDIASVTPANGSTVNIAETPATLTFTAAGELGFYPMMKINVACEGAEYAGTATVTDATVADGVTTFTTTLSEPITVNGEYTVTIPEGVVGDADYIANWTTGHANKAMTLSFTIEGGAGQKEPVKLELQPTITPENGSHLSIGQQVIITFVFPAGTVATSEQARASLQCQSANYFDTALFMKGETDGTFTLKYGTTPKREGTYTMTIKENTFFNKELNSANPELNLSWEIKDTGIDGIFTDETIEGGVYNLNGVYVGESLENLPAGIYVVKGHKVAVSK